MFKKVVDDGNINNTTAELLFNHSIWIKSDFEDLRKLIFPEQVLIDMPELPLNNTKPRNSRIDKIHLTSPYTSGDKNLQLLNEDEYNLFENLRSILKGVMGWESYKDVTLKVFQEQNYDPFKSGLDLARSRNIYRILTERIREETRHGSCHHGREIAEKRAFLDALRIMLRLDN
jgi:hypothetical protein